MIQDLLEEDFILKNTLQYPVWCNSFYFMWRLYFQKDLISKLHSEGWS